MDHIEALMKVWPIVVFLLGLAFAVGGIWVQVNQHSKALTRLFKYHDEHQKQIMDVLFEIRNTELANRGGG